MVATDTVVGIVGAVLLVAVMAGVFAYEYNNPVDGAGEGSDADLRAHFGSAYPGLSADDDVDHDGHANYVDDDIDGDGTPNAADSDVSVHSEMSGALGPAAGPQNPELRLGLYVGNGSVHVTSTVTTTAAVANPLFSGNFVIQLLRPDGTIASNKASSPGGTNTFTVETQMGDEIPAGNWTVRVSQNQAGTGGTVQITADVHYPEPANTAAGHVHEK
jgi:hypothetical protein